MELVQGMTHYCAREWAETHPNLADLELGSLYGDENHAPHFGLHNRNMQ